MNRLDKKVIILSTLALVLSLGLFGCAKTQKPAVNTNQNQNTNVEANANTNVATTTEEIDTSNWKTYRNEEYGFEFKYPGDWGYAVVKSTGTIGFGSALSGLSGEDSVLFDADFLVFPSFKKYYFEFEKNRSGIIKSTFKNNNSLIFVVLDGSLSGQEEETPLWKWRSYYLKDNDNYLRFSCLNQIYDVDKKIWLTKNNQNFCDNLIKEIKVNK